MRALGCNNMLTICERPRSKLRAEDWQNAGRNKADVRAVRGCTNHAIARVPAINSHRHEKNVPFVSPRVHPFI